MSDAPQSMNPQDALIAVTLLTAIADERMSDSEFLEIQAMLKILPIFRDFDESRFNGIVDTVMAFLEEEDGLDSLLALITAAIPLHLRETAYALACDVAAADGAVQKGEMRLLEELRHGLELDRLNAAAIERGSRARHMRL